ncbi:MAG: hypothetical protein CMM80_00760 [Rhodospirillaceae bacterium]|nr:hypothetical protein [Rhodospirillaceae bacterium]|tara:strand:+ start:3433 stop:3612 length:180 start_codon:yes stop_codon:yes gene_type:complete
MDRKNPVIIGRSAKKIEEWLIAGFQKMISPKSIKDTIYGTIIALAVLFCLLFIFEQYLR